MTQTTDLPRGVLFNAYPDSIGHRLADSLAMLSRPELDGAFSLFYVLPTFFHSDLDRGFSIIDYDMEETLVTRDDLAQLEQLGIGLKLDLVLNHLSVGSPQFQDLLAKGTASAYKDFFIDWNAFWHGEGEMGPGCHIEPHQQHLDKLFMRKPGLPILCLHFPDGSERPYWNTFYQEITRQEITTEDLHGIADLDKPHTQALVEMVNGGIRAGHTPGELDWGELNRFKRDVCEVVERRRRYLGQMDLNAASEQVWDFYEETLSKLDGYGAKLVRLDAFAYLHKAPGEHNFFNEPGTWDYLERLCRMADRHDLTLLPEIHAKYGQGLHEAVAAKGFPIYDFFLPGLVIDALDRGTARHLLRWIGEIRDQGMQTVNMLGCHDGIPLLDLKGHGDRPGLLDDAAIDAMVERILKRGGRVKNLFKADGSKIDYYQVNATFFSALGEDERKLRLARAIQMFMPGIPQVWYLDLFAGTNNHAAADNGGTGGHKEINRTTLTQDDIDQGLRRAVVQDQLELLRLRNSSSAFDGDLAVHQSDDHLLQLSWSNGSCTARLSADLKAHSYRIEHRDENGVEGTLSFG